VPVADGSIGAITGGLLRRVGLGPATAGLAPDDEPHLGGSGDSQRHRRPAIGLHRRLWRAWLSEARGLWAAGVALGGAWTLGGGRGSCGFGGSSWGEDGFERIPIMSPASRSSSCDLLQERSVGVNPRDCGPQGKYWEARNMSRLIEEIRHLDAWMEQAPPSQVVLIGSMTGALLALLYWAWW